MTAPEFETNIVKSVEKNDSNPNALRLNECACLGNATMSDLRSAILGKGGQPVPEEFGHAWIDTSGVPKSVPNTVLDAAGGRSSMDRKTTAPQGIELGRATGKD